MSKESVLAIKDQILLRALEDVPFESVWSLELVQRAAEAEGLEEGTVRAVFPAGLGDVLAHFSNYADRMMVEQLNALSEPPVRIRDKIGTAIMARYEILEPHKEAVRLSANHWARPLSQGRGAKMVWQSADCIWNWAGDTSTDYNYYTKRGLLSGILSTSMFVWLNDKDPNHEKTKRFVDRRIENVMQFGKILGRIKK